MQSKKRALVVVLFVASVAFSVWFSFLKQDALGYHTRDFAYFAQTQAKLLDATLTPRLSLNPDGHSFLGIRGTEAEKSIHQGIHFAPIKYIHTLLYAVTGSLFLVYLFNSFLVFAPGLYVGYLGCTFGKKDGAGDRDAVFYFLMAVAYLIYPSIHHVATHDLRHYIFLAPLFVLSIASIHFERPTLERILLFNLLFFAREEALVLGSVVIFYGLALQARKGVGSLFRTEMKWYLLSYAFWYTAIMSYYVWAGYTQETPLVHRALIVAGFLLLGIAGILVMKSFIAKHNIPGGNALAGFLAIIPVFGPFIYHGGVWREIDIFSILYFDRYFLYAVCLYVSVLALWRVVVGATFRRAMIGAMTVFVAVVLFANTPLYELPAYLTKREMPIVSATAQYIDEREDAGIVHRLAEKLDPAQAVVLVDYRTHQAFYDFEEVYTWERLPWYLVAGKERFYPENEERLRRLIQDRVQYIVVGKKWRKTVESELESLGMQDNVVVIDRNDEFSVMKIERS